MTVLGRERERQEIAPATAKFCLRKQIASLLAKFKPGVTILARNLVITVVESKGMCPVYRVGDLFRIEDGYRLVSDIPLCMHALASLLPYYVPLSRGVAPTELGLTRQGNTAYVQCLDPCEWTGGGTVVFGIRCGD